MRGVSRQRGLGQSTEGLGSGGHPAVLTTQVGRPYCYILSNLPERDQAACALE